MTDSDTLLMARIESAIRFAPPSFTPIRGPVPTAVSAEHNASHNGPRYISPQFIPGQPFQRRKRPGPLPDFVSRDDIPQASGQRQRQPDVALAACGFFTRGRHQYAVAEREPVPKTDSAFIAMLKEPVSSMLTSMRRWLPLWNTVYTYELKSKPRPRKPEPNYDAIVSTRSIPPVESFH